MAKTKKIDSTKTKLFSLRIERDILEQLELIAKHENLSVSYVIRKALRKGLNMPQLAKNVPVQLPENWE